MSSQVKVADPEYLPFVSVSVPFLLDIESFIRIVLRYLVGAGRSDLEYYNLHHLEHLVQLAAGNVLSNLEYYCSEAIIFEGVDHE